MAVKKNARHTKKQLGQFMTPRALSASLVKTLELTRDTKVLEPSFGNGSYLFALIDNFIAVYSAEGVTKDEAIRRIMAENIYGVEMDASLVKEFRSEFQKVYGLDLDETGHNLVVSDFFRWQSDQKFDLIVGNPPFGGTFDPEIEDELDKRYGLRDGYKVKKETYAFFTVRCLDLLKPQGTLQFILSDTFLTINTMQGLRRLCVSSGRVQVDLLSKFSEETDYGMVVLTVDKGVEHSRSLRIYGRDISLSAIEVTPNFSWTITPELAALFAGERLSSYLTATSGMTIGNNRLFLREVRDGKISEPYDFSLGSEPITLEGELSRARLGKLSPAQRQKVADLESQGATRDIVVPTERDTPQVISLPHPDYAPYNKASAGRWTAPLNTVIFWRGDGQYVYTFKKSGPWYLHGVGGRKFFKKEGLTWSLIASEIRAKYLPPGYILDSGAPVAVVKDSVADRDVELMFILGWLNTSFATRILKTVLNHTRNIQGKDVERLPYPWWVSEANKVAAVQIVRSIVSGSTDGTLGQDRIAELEAELETLYALPEDAAEPDA